MTGFYGINSNSVGTLFSSFSSGRNTGSTSNVFSATSIVSDYYSIRNGSYKKLLNAYYEKYGKEDTNTAVSSKKSTTVSKDSTEQLAKVKSSSNKLSESTAVLLQNGSKSLFKEVELTDKDGNKTMGYDTDKIYDSVKSFVDNYNDVIKTAENSSVNSVARARTSMISSTKANSKMLASMGITINENNTLSIDEEKFKKADMSSVKSLFGSTGSYSYAVASRASQMSASAAFEASKTNTYTNSARYSSSLSSGDLYDSLF